MDQKTEGAAVPPPVQQEAPPATPVVTSNPDASVPPGVFTGVQSHDVSAPPAQPAGAALEQNQGLPVVGSTLGTPGTEVAQTVKPSTIGDQQFHNVIPTTPDPSSLASVSVETPEARVHTTPVITNDAASSTVSATPHEANPLPSSTDTEPTIYVSPLTRKAIGSRFAGFMKTGFAIAAGK